jgi:cation diffusion facilitator family transporter
MDIVRSRRIKRASWIGIGANSVLAAAKVIIGLTAGSLAVVGDGIDSTSDIITSVISLFTAIIITKPPDRTHPYGHFRAETIATSVLAFIMFFVGAELFRSSVTDVIHKTSFEVPALPALYVTGFSIFAKTGLALYLRRLGRRINSQMLIANGKNMQNDILISAGVLAGLFFVVFLELPIIDPVLAIAISLWIMYSAVKIFFESITELMDGVKEKEVYTSILEAIKETGGAVNPHRIRVRKLSSLYVIDLDIEVDGGMTVTAAHGIAMEAERLIKEKVDNVYDIMVHVEPKGNVETEEQFGISGGGDS